MRRRSRAILLFAACLLAGLSACENTQFRAREKGALAGGALGAGLGAIVGNQVGSPGAGIAIGSAIGALSGGLVGEGIDQQDDAIADTDRRIAERDRELRENQRLLNELRAQGLEVRDTERGLVVNLPDVLFEFDSAHLTAAARHKVALISKRINEAGKRRIFVEGHTDSIGSFAYNQRLSDDRARSVAAELVADGVSRSQITTRGYGERQPIASNNTDSGRSRNRRVEVVISKR